MKKLIFSKFGGLQAYSRQLYYQMNSFTGIFRQYFKLPPCPPCFDLSHPPPLHQIFSSPPCSKHLWETLVYTTAAMGLRNSSENLDEILSRVLGDLIA